VPHVAVIQFRDGLIESAHIYWDQASVLVQAGLIQNEELPVAGVETAQKILNPDRPSNTLITRATEIAGGRGFASYRQKQIIRLKDQPATGLRHS
jgi:hypothetical protein